MKVMMYFVIGSEDLIGQVSTPLQLLLGIIVSFLYILLFSTLGYLAGILSQLSKLFVFLLPGLFFGTLILGMRSNGESTIIVETIKFFSEESSFLLFVTKIMVVVFVLFYGSIVVSNRLEVRK
ncbi:hypothetical protein ACOI1C_04225 [Bacillus sp. DJP31]|uniref:hypothetical protein n=1 Tax=Bacillus sp. DJP31 TaxID=3409789 RepID=UPI003BB81215